VTFLVLPVRKYTVEAGVIAEYRSFAVQNICSQEKNKFLYMHCIFLCSASLVHNL
jgi:hypothetical protein